MFEDSLFASGNTKDKLRNAGRSRWIAISSVALQAAMLACFLAVPLIWPETLPLVSVAPKALSLSARKPEVKVDPKVVRLAAVDDHAMHAPAHPVEIVNSGGSHLFSHGPSTVNAGSEPPTGIGGPGMVGPGTAVGLGPGFGSGFGPGNAPVVVAVTPRPTKPIVISQGVSKGLLLAPITPVYPRIAIAAHVEGTVIVTATIDKRGRIVSLQVLSGPEMLRTSAVDAVKEARYRPYTLNGEPTDVITTISINFRFGS